MGIPGIWLALPCALMEGFPACSGVYVAPACRCSGSSGLVGAWWFGISGLEVAVLDKWWLLEDG